MSKKGKLTKELIVERAAGLFNSIGYYRASMSDLMNATGLEKGGIYNHFKSKDELAVAAFEYARRVFSERVSLRVQSETEPMEKLLAFLAAFSDVVENPPLPGGCPLLNCAVENSDSNPLLGEQVKMAFESFLNSTEQLLISARESGALKKDIDTRQVATFIVSSLEGGIMLSNLYKEPDRMKQVCESLKAYISLLRT
ncbi:MAG: TetR/AcrR family transcriptional regulator [Candidatus Obscuribacterales bacterium]|nr:TetR/AcrR family transcriptional regulator [Candidatus Obscuribacterales bacterium]